MNDDYLWDRTGEPDPEIQQLEDVLGTLRYQPQPLPLPAAMEPQRERRYAPRMAIAAAVALLMLAAGLWLRVHRSTAPQPPAVAKDTSAATPLIRTTDKQRQQPAPSSPLPKSNNDLAAGHTNSQAITKPVDAPRKRITTPTLAKRQRHESSVTPPDDQDVAQLDQARAKEQLMLALRLASAKLNLAQRKTQGPPTPGNIRNQHKVG